MSPAYIHASVCLVAKATASRAFPRLPLPYTRLSHVFPLPYPLPLRPSRWFLFPTIGVARDPPTTPPFTQPSVTAPAVPSLCGGGALFIRRL